MPVLLLAGCGGGGSAVATPNPVLTLRAMQIRTSDVPSGFMLAAQTYLAPKPSAQLEGVEPSLYLRHGGGASLAERFVLRHPATVGLTFIFSQVLTFSTSADARWGFQQLRATLARSGTIGTVQQTINFSATPTPLPTMIKSIPHPVPSLPTRYAPEKVPLVGETDAGFTNDSDSYAGEYVFTNQVIVFRRGRYCAVVHISGNYGQVPLGTALQFSRLIDERIRKALTNSHASASEIAPS
ncbi:MAG TPA: hypothetical protein VIO57_03425 [Chloroflexota bacterium]